MRILLISNMYPSNEFPSYGVFVKNTEDILKTNNCIIKRVVLKKQVNKVLKVINYILFYINILYEGMLSKNDLIYVHYASHCAIPLIILKRLRTNIKIYTNVHGSDVVPESKKNEKLQKYVKVLLLISDKVIVPSNYFKRLVNSKYELDKNKIYVFPSGGINEEKFYHIEEKNLALNEMNLDNNYKYIGYVGRIDFNKGWDVFLKAIKLLKESGMMKDKKALVIGNGKEIGKFKNYICYNGLSNDIIWLDLLHQDKLVYAYNSMEVFCFPTMREGESLGLVGLESMACGTPIVASNFAGPSDYVEDSINGYLFELGNYNQLAKKVTEYIDLPYEKKQCVKRKALEKAKSYYVTNISNDIVEIIKSI